MTQLWFGRVAVSRSQYIKHGLGLLVIKYALDSLVLYLDAAQFMAPWTYLSPSLMWRLDGISNARISFLVMGLLSLPFVWIGVSMSIRRARDAGFSPWVGLLFFMPFINWLMIFALCAGPTRQANEARKGDQLPAALPQALKALVAGIATGLVALLVSVFGLEEYGSALFAGTPFVMGVVSAYLAAQSGHTSIKRSVGIALLGLGLCGGAMLLLALEGGICLMMAAPLAAALAAMGALVGRSMAQAQSGGAVASLLLALPLTMAMPGQDLDGWVHSAVTEVVVDAPPEAVWKHVVSFPDLPPPSDWLMKTGIACPVRARIEGEGVGAVRHCEFTTGAFVEPITVWNPPHHLAFDVTKQPPPMHEWSPYQHVHAPHLAGSMKSRRGEFRLERLPDNKTRLVGTTWYTLDMAPQIYWKTFSDAIIGRIHERVLDHVKALAEADVQGITP